MHRFLLAGALLLSFAGSVAAQETTKVTSLMSRDLSDIPGKEGDMLIVEYAPGAEDPVHRHNANAFVYVLEGSVVIASKPTRSPQQSRRRFLTTASALGNLIASLAASKRTTDGLPDLSLGSMASQFIATYSSTRQTFVMRSSKLNRRKESFL